MADTEMQGKVPGDIVALEFAYLIALTGSALAYYHLHSIQRLLPAMWGPIPIGVVWWGALGGLTISFSGIVIHRKNFDSSLRVWYILKPFLAMITASASYLMITLLIKSTGTTVAPGSTTFYVLAFLVGYREETFRSLIKEVTDIFLKPGKSSPPNS
jgi:hypothetical protein